MSRDYRHQRAPSGYVIGIGFNLGSVVAVDI